LTAISEGLMKTSLRALLALALLLGLYLLSAGLVLSLVLAVVLVARNGLHAALLLKIGLVTAVVLLGVGRGLLAALRGHSQPPVGVELTRTSQPRLWAEIEQLAEKVGTRAPDELWLVPDVNAAVSEDVRMLGLRPGVRRLYVGAPLLAGLTALQLRSVFAHELGHYSGRHTALAGVTYRGKEALRRVIGNLGAESIAGKIFMLYGRLYVAVSHSVNRQQELEADRHSVRVAGRNAATAALREVAAIDHAWGFFRDTYADAGVELRRRPVALFDGFQRFLAEPTRQLQLVEVRRLPVDGTRSIYDSHPPLTERITRMTKLPDDDIVDDATPALGLLDEPQRAMEALEAWMFEDSGLTAVSWDEIVAAAGAAQARADARLLTDAAEAAGVASPATLNAVFDAVRRGQTGAMVLPLMKPDSAPEALREVAERLLTQLVVTALIDVGKVTYRLNWAGPWRLVGPDGTEADPGRLVARAIDDANAAYALQGWLTACDVPPQYRVATDAMGP
jgi:Zn-dependent protease with chaperone function